MKGGAPVSPECCRPQEEHHLIPDSQVLMRGPGAWRYITTLFAAKTSEKERNINSVPRCTRRRWFYGYCDCTACLTLNAAIALGQEWARMLYLLPPHPS
jgi:hypothetical protein